MEETAVILLSELPSVPDSWGMLTWLLGGRHHPVSYFIELFHEACDRQGT